MAEVYLSHLLTPAVIKYYHLMKVETFATEQYYIYEMNMEATEMLLHKYIYVWNSEDFSTVYQVKVDITNSTIALRFQPDAAVGGCYLRTQTYTK